MFPLAIGYAETHYRFRLPWSPLHRPWPEILIDAPWQFVPGASCHAWLVVKDAHQFPVRIREVLLELRSSNGTVFSTTFGDWDCHEPFHFIALPFARPQDPGTYLLSARIRAERNGRLSEFWNHNLPGLAPVAIQCQFPEQTPPRLQGFLEGESHCHSWNTNDQVEFGAPPSVLHHAASSIGLDWCTITDHSYDFAWDHISYLQPADANERWNTFQNEVAALPGKPLFIAGEEVSCGNQDGRNVHLLVPGHQTWVPGQGDGGRRWLNNHPDLQISEVLERVAPLPCFAAHPCYPMGFMERFIFHRGDWHENDLGYQTSNPITGLEFWNGDRDAGFHKGKALWISQLLQGRRLLPIGGSDAHGDLGRSTRVHVPLLSLAQGTTHLFGKVRTGFWSSSSPETAADLHQIIRSARDSGLAYATDGPSIALIQDANGQIRLQAVSASPITHAKIFAGLTGDTSETLHWQSTPDTTAIETVVHPPRCNYLRAEVECQDGTSALTAALTSS